MSSKRFPKGVFKNEKKEFGPQTAESNAQSSPQEADPMPSGTTKAGSLRAGHPPRQKHKCECQQRKKEFGPQTAESNAQSSLQEADTNKAPQK
jgi:hypothetical protein